MTLAEKICRGQWLNNVYGVAVIEGR